MRDVTHLFVHCSATEPMWRINETGWSKRQEIRRWHVEGNGWRDIGYADLIDRDGAVIKGRDTDNDGDTWDDIGAHVRGYNGRSIGVCLIGGKGSNENDHFRDHYTEAQEKALLHYIDRVRARYPRIIVMGHNEVDNGKACPGFDVQRWLARTKSRKPVTVPRMPASRPTGLAAFFAFLSRLFKGT